MRLQQKWIIQKLIRPDKLKLLNKKKRKSYDKLELLNKSKRKRANVKLKSHAKRQSSRLQRKHLRIVNSRR